MKTTFNPSAKTITGTALKTTFLTILTIFFFIAFVSAQYVSNLVKIDTRLCVGANVIDANVVVFDAVYSNAVDGDDAYKFSNSGENIAIQRGTALLVVEGRQPATANDVIPFRIWNMQQQTYRLEFVPSNFANSAMLPLLEDTYLHTTTIINSIAPTSVNFTVTSNPATFAPNRFRIIFTAAAPLPVTFISINAEKNTAGICVNWKVAGQVNIKNYEVEKSFDGIQFYSAGTVAAISNSNTALHYRFIDNNISTTISFYRIKSVDNDGRIKYSSILKVNGVSAGKGFAVLSNPVLNNILNIQFKNQPGGVYNIVLVNAEGKRTLSCNVRHAEGTSNESISLPGNGSSGIYWLQITTPANEKEIRMIIIKN